MLKHKINLDKIQTCIGGFSDMTVLVIGDTILDEYIHCSPLGMSQEDPTIVVSPIKSNNFLGGAGIVASHISRLGANAKLMSVVGSDAESEMVADFLKNIM